MTIVKEILSKGKIAFPATSSHEIVGCFQCDKNLPDGAILMIAEPCQQCGDKRRWVLKAL